MSPGASDGERLAFWLNAYNRLVRDELAARPRHGHLIRHRRLFRTVTLEHEGLRFTPDVIEHGLLRGNRRPPYGLRPLLRTGDPRLAHAPSGVDPRIHFALNCGARSCPPVRDYDAAQVDEQLEAATRDHVLAHTDVDRARGVVELPYLLRLYRADFADPVAFVAERIGEDLAGLRVGYSGYDWRMALNPPG